MGAQEKEGPKPAAKAGGRSASGNSRAAPNAETTFGSQEWLGNAALARLLASGALRPKLEVSDPGDSHEREADEVADRMLRTTEPAGVSWASGRRVQRSCSSCSAGAPCEECEEGRLDRAVDKGAAGPAPVPAASRLGPGRPLDRPLRSFFEPRLGRDLSDVRIHTSSEAGESARELHAHAFTLGRDVAFADGKYTPETDHGRRLLAHELVHVAQQAGDGTVLRQDDGSSTNTCSSPVSADPTDGGFAAGAQCVDTSLPATPPANATADPCDVDVASLTNADLLQQFVRARDYMRAHPHMDDYYAHKNLFARTLTERQARMQAGEVWLGEDVSGVPATLYRLVPGQFGEVNVIQEDPSVAGGQPRRTPDSSVLTPGQFESYLRSQRIPRITIDQFLSRQTGDGGPPSSFFPDASPVAATGGTDADLPFLDLTGSAGGDDWPAAIGSGITGGGLYRSPFAVASQDLLARPVPSSTIGRSNWRGFLGETSYGYNSLLGPMPFQDINTLTGSRNFPIFDLRNRVTGNLISVKTSVPANTDAPNIDTYLSGWNDLAAVPRKGATPTTFNNALGRLAAQGVNLSAADAIQSSYLAVNDDHVAQVRTAVADALKDPANSGTYGTLFDAYLRQESVRVGGVEYGTWASLDAIRTTNPGDYAAGVEELANRARARVIGNGLTTAELRNLQSFRSSYPTVAEGDFARLASPELIDSARYGGGLAGTAMAMRRSAVRGGAGGLVIGTAFEGFSLLRHGDFSANAWTRFGTGVGLSGAGGALSSTIETGFDTWASRGLLTEAAAGGTSSLAAPLASRVAGGTIAGGIVAPAVTIGSMAADPEHTFAGVDYAARGTRAFVAGGISSGVGVAAGGLAAGWVAAGGLGAAAGSWAPGIGTAVGFLVGVGVYFAVDALVGDTVEEGVRSAIGEPAGCPRTPT